MTQQLHPKCQYMTVQKSILCNKGLCQLVGECCMVVVTRSQIFSDSIEL